MYISIIALVSRPESIELLRQNLQLLSDKNHIMEVIIGTDNNQINITEDQLTDYKWRNLTIFNSNERPPSQSAMDKRRTRISNMHNMIRERVGASQFVFGFEDDTVLLKGTLDRLLDDFKRLNGQIEVGMIEGVQVGRWGRPYIGAWEVDDIKNPTRFTSLPYKERKGMEPIDAGGLYCFLVPTDLYKKVHFEWHEPLGPDVHFGLELRKMGYQNFIDWSVVTGHKSGYGELYPSEKVEQVRHELVDHRWHNKIGAFK